ncbi:MAG: putative 2OG-Fe(II) oxygenase [Pseudomonadota bacterium]
MAEIFTPTKDREFFAPFGPVLGYYKLPVELVDTLNNAMSEQLRDYSDQLVGKVHQELQFDNPLLETAGRAIKDFIKEFHIYARKRNSFGKYSEEGKDFRLQIMSGWFVRQFEHEYNPLHIHTGAALSCVGYLKLPDGIEAEWEKDYEDHHPSHGHIQFAHGTDVHYSFSNFMAKPRVGDFYVFPSHLFHCVYPFSTKGERRSFSMNMTVHEQTL